jgi:G:T/U-mismatch repair DNA glycosylase
VHEDSRARGSSSGVPERRRALTPEIQRLEVNAQLQRKLAERAEADKQIAELQYQQRLNAGPQTVSASDSFLSKRDAIWIFVVLAMIGAGFWAQGSTSPAHRRASFGYYAE